MIPNPPISSLIFMYRHYLYRAKECWGLYTDMTDAYRMYDYYMDKVKFYEDILRKELI